MGNRQKAQLGAPTDLADVELAYINLFCEGIRRQFQENMAKYMHAYEYPPVAGEGLESIFIFSFIFLMKSLHRLEGEG